MFLFFLQPVGFVTFQTRAGAEAAKQDLQVRFTKYTKNGVTTSYFEVSLLLLLLLFSALYYIIMYCHLFLRDKLFGALIEISTRADVTRLIKHLKITKLYLVRVLVPHPPPTHIVYIHFI